MVNDGKEKFDLYKIDTKEKIDKKKILLVILILLSIICLFLIGKNVNNAIKNYQVYKKYEAQILTLKQADVERQKQEAEIKEKEKQAKLPKLTDVGKENMKHIYSSDEKRVFLTFDDGPSAVTTKILNTLKQANVKATFFLIGENAENTPELVKRESEEGHLVGNHTYHHVEITRVPDETAKEEILMTNEVITGITGEEVSYMRPPFGAWQKQLEWELDVMPVMWTIDPLDWTTNNEDEIVNKVVTQAKENDIILLHDCYESSVNAALRIVDILQKEGFEFVTVDELIMN